MISEKIDRVIAVFVLLIASLISIMKVNQKIIFEFHNLLNILGYGYFRIYILNFIYNLSLLIISFAIFNLYSSYNSGGIMAKILQKKSPISIDGLYFNEILVLFFVFLSINLLLTIYLYRKERRVRIWNF